jgi:hypothetical protein
VDVKANGNVCQLKQSFVVKLKEVKLEQYE